MSLTIIIPAYNEEESLPVVVPDLKAFASANGFKLIIVNDGSKDNTKEILNGFADSDILSVVHHKVNKGYGAAIKTGIRLATTTYTITVDADGQHRTEDILKLYNAIKDADADLIVGGRIDQKNASYMRGFGKSVIRLFVKLMIRVSIFDINSGMKIYRTDLARKYVRLAPDTMAFSDIMTIIFVHFGDQVLEIPIRVNERAFGKSTINYKTGLDTIKEIVFIATVFAPYKFFSLLSSILLVATLCWGLPFILADKGVTPGTASGVLVSVLLWCLGVIAQLISGIRKDLIDNHS
ncbi:MAG: glycosyltransferase family 2 protein [Ferruginibacter sp.]